MNPDRKQHLASACSGILAGLLADCAGVLWATVSTKDGIEIASAGTSAHEHLSVMSGTMQALADSIVAEAALGACHDVILRAERGSIAILSVREGDDQLVLAGMGSAETTIGMLLSCCTTACTQIGRLALPRNTALVHGPEYRQQRP